MKPAVYRPTQALSRAVEGPVTRIADQADRLVVTVPVSGINHHFELLWAGEGWPGDVASILTDLPSPWPRELVVVGRRFSPGALDLLAERDANWVDETGRARIRGSGGVLVIRDTERNIDETATSRAFNWSASSVDIAEALLVDPSAEINARETAEQTGWSHAQTTSVLRRFDKQGWTVKLGAKRGPKGVRRLAGPADLLNAWADHVSGAERVGVLAHRVLRDPMDFLRDDLASALPQSVAWAASGWAGLEIASPFLTIVPALQIYISADAIADGRLRRAMKTTGLREVQEGARVEFWPASAVALSLSRPGPVPVASPPRLYADLRGLGGRGEEAAQHVREELIGF